MDFLIQAGATGVPLAAALAGGSAAMYYRRRARKLEHRATRLARERNAEAADLEAVAVALDRLAYEVVPAMVQADPEARMRFPGLLPTSIEGSAVGERLTALAQSLGHAVQQVRAEEATGAADRLAETQRAAEEATWAVVRGVATSMVAIASRLSRQVSMGAREHADDQAYASLMAIDRHGQQLLLAAQNYLVLSGGKLSRRWPDCTVVDVVRAAMGYLEGFERIEHKESGTPGTAVTARAVGPVIHAFALLLDNALRYSPPTAHVEVRLTEGYHGVTVTIDDAGMGMSPEQVAEAREVLSGALVNDIALEAQPRVGFRVVAALGRAYGFQADVQALAFQGTRALLFLPKSLLTTVAEPAPSPPAPDVPPVASATTENGLTVRRPRRAAPRRTTAAAGQEDLASAQPGRASVAMAWAHGIGRGRQDSVNDD
ncbi:sensor histidine kinase [Streptomyces sp. HB132]|uniref:ATP-binding protein n=1 Tax=Streptomyces sp. HB132 TaxID=767388 RepID=UPI00195F7613|nr:sensor histidine kinase [Streptomyces sp. HB132]MBM7438724.1 signal transduction histidine kinase [Streptomyces sp. HB132]